MNASRPLLYGEFVFQKFLTDYEDLDSHIDDFDLDISDDLIELASKFEVDRKVRLELWTRAQFKRFRNSRSPNPELRLANFFEMCVFSREFNRAHLDFDAYYGFDSIIGKATLGKYWPVIHESDDENSSMSLYVVNLEIEGAIPSHCLMVTHTTLL